MPNKNVKHPFKVSATVVRFSRGVEELANASGSVTRTLGAALSSPEDFCHGSLLYVPAFYFTEREVAEPVKPEIGLAWKSDGATRVVLDVKDGRMVYASNAKGAWSTHTDPVTKTLHDPQWPKKTTKSRIWEYVEGSFDVEKHGTLTVLVSTKRPSEVVQGRNHSTYCDLYYYLHQSEFPGYDLGDVLYIPAFELVERNSRGEPEEPKVGLTWEHEGITRVVLADEGEVVRYASNGVHGWGVYKATIDLLFSYYGYPRKPDRKVREWKPINRVTGP